MVINLWPFAKHITNFLTNSSLYNQLFNQLFPISANIYNQPFDQLFIVITNTLTNFNGCVTIYITNSLTNFYKWVKINITNTLMNCWMGAIYCLCYYSQYNVTDGTICWAWSIPFWSLAGHITCIGFLAIVYNALFTYWAPVAISIVIYLACPTYSINTFLSSFECIFTVPYNKSNLPFTPTILPYQTLTTPWSVFSIPFCSFTRYLE